MGISSNPAPIRRKLSRSVSFQLSDEIVDIDSPALNQETNNSHSASLQPDSPILLGRVSFKAYRNWIDLQTIPGKLEIKVFQSYKSGPFNASPANEVIRYRTHIWRAVRNNKERWGHDYYPAPLRFILSAKSVNSKCKFIMNSVERGNNLQITIEIRWNSNDPESLKTDEALSDEYVRMYWANGGRPLLNNKPGMCLNEDEEAVNYEAIDIPDTFDVISCPQPESPFKLQLFEYQLRTLAWMQGVEDGEPSLHYAPNIFPFDYDSYIELPNLEGMNVEEMRERCPSVRGGILADKPGIGKTITTIALCHMRPAEDFEEVDDSAGLEPFTTKIPSKATIIFAPDNICEQWESEVRKCLGDSANVFQIKGKLQYAKTCIKDIIEADFIIVSYNFLQNSSYRGMLQGVSTRRQRKITKKDKHYAFTWFNFHRIVYDEFHEISDRARMIQEQVCVMCADSIWGLTGTPRLESSEAVMECAEFLNLDPWNNWQVPELETVRFIKNRIRRNEPDVTYPEPIYETIDVFQSPAEFSFYRACASTAKPLNLLMLCNHYQILMSVVEVTGTRILTIEDVSERVQQSRIAHMARLNREINANMDELNRMQERLNGGHGNPEILNERIEQTQNRLAQIQNELRVTEGQFNYFKNFVESYADETSDTSCAVCFEDEIAKKDAGVLPCGHAFCFGCADAVVARSRQCPTCRSRTNTYEVMKLPPPVKKNEIEVERYYDGVGTLNPNLFGSKIRELVDYIYKTLKESFASRFIIFIQFRNLADIVSDALHTYGINNARLKKGWKEREAALKRFKDSVVDEEAAEEMDLKDKGKRKAVESLDPPKKSMKSEGDKIEIADDLVKVLILSAADSVSGLNLTEASHCIILHPFYSEKEEYAMAAEEQGIARVLRHGQKKRVKIVRFVVRNTMEDEIHRRREAQRQH
ncbi:DNA helicase rad5 [Nowakowskiella sp. JEL0407]|nr:DNA helicase rad5 [Nowakowskiella sp. JEL0407]